MWQAFTTAFVVAFQGIAKAFSAFGRLCNAADNMAKLAESKSDRLVREHEIIAEFELEHLESRMKAECEKRSEQWPDGWKVNQSNANPDGSTPVADSSSDESTESTTK